MLHLLKNIEYTKAMEFLKNHQKQAIPTLPQKMAVSKQKKKKKITPEKSQSKATDSKYTYHTHSNKRIIQVSKTKRSIPSHTSVKKFTHLREQRYRDCILQPRLRLRSVLASFRFFFSFSVDTDRLKNV